MTKLHALALLATATAAALIAIPAVRWAIREDVRDELSIRDRLGIGATRFLSFILQLLPRAGREFPEVARALRSLAPGRGSMVFLTQRTRRTQSSLDYGVCLR